MSVILKCPYNKIRLFIKGADNIIRERISLNHDIVKVTDNFLMNFAQKGLRTLMVAYKEISKEDAYEQGIKLLRLMAVVYQPMTKEDFDFIQKRRNTALPNEQLHDYGT
jgi:magnesium-transporting ATPase (P-type)